MSSLLRFCGPFACPLARARAAVRAGVRQGARAHLCLCACACPCLPCPPLFRAPAGASGKWRLPVPQVAFKSCSPALGWAVAVASVLHELPSELSQFWILVDPRTGGLASMQALLLYFVSSLATVVGAVAVSAVEARRSAFGVLLAVGGGALLNLGVLSVWPDRRATPAVVGACALAFAAGATCVGLVLMHRGHCGGADPPGHAR